jgi:hypothetical protein
LFLFICMIMYGRCEFSTGMTTTGLFWDIPLCFCLTDWYQIFGGITTSIWRRYVLLEVYYQLTRLKQRAITQEAAIRISATDTPLCTQFHHQHSSHKKIPFCFSIQFQIYSIRSTGLCRWQINTIIPILKLSLIFLSYKTQCFGELNVSPSETLCFETPGVG